MKQYLLERDALNGKEGVAFATINGEVVEIFRFRNFSFTAQFDEADFRVVGTRKKQKKTTGINLNWNATVYMGMPVWAQICQQFVDEGTVVYFSMNITNDDPNVTIGRQTVQLQNCKLSSCDIIKLDADSDFLDQSISGSCLQFKMLENFTEPEIIGGNA